MSHQETCPTEKKKTKNTKGKFNMKRNLQEEIKKRGSRGRGHAYTYG